MINLLLIYLWMHAAHTLVVKLLWGERARFWGFSPRSGWCTAPMGWNGLPHAKFHKAVNSTTWDLRNL